VIFRTHLISILIIKAIKVLSVIATVAVLDQTQHKKLILKQTF